MSKLIFKTDKNKYTFSDYFDLNIAPEDIAGEFGYLFETKILDLPISLNIDHDEILTLQKTFYEILPKISLNSEMAKRDFMIAPVLWSIIRHVPAKINVEYPIEVNDKLSGSLDYLIRSKQTLIVIEAKKGDLDKGFNQLTVELIALDQFEPNQANSQLIYGAVSIGELWRFSFLDRNNKQIYRDLHTYRIPEDLENIFSILLGMLQQM